MPFGPEPLGLVYFAGVKLAGYSAAGVYLRNRLGQARPRAIAFGAARTALGIGAGVAVASSLAAINIDRLEPLFYFVLLPVRVAEWLLAIWWFFGRRIRMSGRTRLAYSAGGALWSYVLDLPAIMAVLVIPGGAWIC